MAPVQFVKRDWFYNDGNGSAWYDYGRWVLLAVIIIVLLIMFLMVQGLSCRRARHGQAPITGTGWLVPPSYYQSQQQQNQDDAVPMYKQEAGQGDAGHFDRHGNFVPYSGTGYPPAGDNTNDYGSHAGAGPSGTYMPHHNTEDYAPPSVPPPSHTMPHRFDDVPPPSGPPPSHTMPNSFDDVPPPPGPPPALSDAAAAYYPPTAPAPAHKN